jgi:hypothetical protein
VIRSIFVGVLAAVSGCIEAVVEAPAPDEPSVSGAGFMTFDALGGELRGGCQNRTTGSQCNAYARKDAVFLSAGPRADSGLADGTYVFAVLAPGPQLAGFLDGNIGNLSDTLAAGTAGDRGGGLGLADRTFVVEDREIVAYAGSHVVGETLEGRVAIGLAPFDDTDHPAGVYVVAICASDASEPSQCAYDAFHITGDEPLPIVRGAVYHDANLDGEWSAGEPGLPGWPVDYHGTITGSVASGSDGRFALEVIPDGYLFVARDVVTADASYWVEAGDQSAGGLYIGVACIDDGCAPRPLAPRPLEPRPL